MNKRELLALPCPFCGGEVGYDFDDTMVAPYGHMLTCSRCATTSGSSPSKEHAIAAWNRRTPAKPSDDMREVVARALCEARIRTVRRHDTKPDDLEAMLPASIDYSWRDFVVEADAALSALTPHIVAVEAAAVEVERARYTSVPIIDQHREEIGIAHRKPADLERVDAFMDDNGTAWTPPTAWAYFAACQARDAAFEAGRAAERAEVVVWLRTLPGSSIGTEIRHLAALTIERNEHGAKPLANR